MQLSMHASPPLFRALLLTSLLSFTVPVLFLGGTIALLSLITYLPPLTSLAQDCIHQILTVLTTFGSGSAVEGALVIGFTCSLVGTLFDACTVYRYQNFRDN